jgi:hypothetical protein
MAVVKVPTVICDQCGASGDCKRYVISFPDDGRRSIDLCSTCREPLDKLESLFEGMPKKGPRPKGQPVVTEAQLARARKPRKATTRK